jgi:hypothetical protein
LPGAWQRTTPSGNRFRGRTRSGIADLTESHHGENLPA